MSLEKRTLWLTKRIQRVELDSQRLQLKWARSVDSERSAPTKIRLKPSDLLALARLVLHQEN